MKRVYLLFVFLIPLMGFSQMKHITLDEAIHLAQKKSPEYQALLNTTQARYWRFRNYKASFLPELALNLSPRYANSLTRITNDEGQDIFVDQNQSIIDARLGLTQQVPYTGGIFSINSQLQRIDRFGDISGTSYSVVPFSINYSQNSLFYNQFRWDKKIEPLLYEESKRDFIEQMEDISMTTCNRYFSLLKAQMQLEIAERNLKNQDTLLQIAKGRFRIGNIAENELLQMELRHLNSQNRVTQFTVELKRASQNLARYLVLENENIELEIPEELEEFEISVDKAMEEAQNNRKAVIEYRRRRIQAERDLAEAKGNNRLRLSVNANFGLNGQSDEYSTLFQDYSQQQNVSLNLGIPLFDWGVSKSRRKMAEADLDLEETNIKRDQQEFEQEIFLHTLNWSNQRNFLKTSDKAQEIALKRYDISQKRYVLGKVDITNLNLAQEERDKAVLDYLNSLESFWTDYYLLRRLTLFDFLKNQKIKVEDLVFD